MQSDVEKIKKRFIELSDRAELQQRSVFSDFLNLDEQSILNSVNIASPVFLYGGTELSERKIACFGFADNETKKEQYPIRCVKIAPVAPKFADELSHRDFLGTLMGLGIKRETIGDIIIYNNIGYVFCLSQIGQYILSNVYRVRHTSVKCFSVDAPPVDSVSLPEKQLITVSSARLDVLVSAVYNLSRTSSQELFEQGRVFVGSRQTNNTSYIVKDNEIISVRGFGRFIFCGSCGETKKGRLKVNVMVF